MIHQLNELHAQDLQKDAQLEARIEAYEIAFKMQAAASDAFNVRRNRTTFAICTATRRRAARCSSPGVCWNAAFALSRFGPAAGTIIRTSRSACRNARGEIDQPLAALMTDLKQRGMLDSTLVIWGGEFGRTPTKDRNGNANPGRDHNAKGFSIWMAGGGVKGGTVYGATDEFGAEAVENPVHIHDLHATILRLLGFDHTKLTYRYNGRDFRLTDVAGSSVTSVNVVKGVIA